MKNIQHYLDTVQKTEQNRDWIDPSKLLNELGINHYINSDVPELECYWAITWICTDTAVGLRLYYLNDKFVAISYQSSRKGDEIFEWVSEQIWKDTRNFMIDRLKTEDGGNGPNIINSSVSLGWIEQHAKYQRELHKKYSGK